jgi:hypothetical protein
LADWGSGRPAGQPYDYFDRVDDSSGMSRRDWRVTDDSGADASAKLS